MTNPYHVLGVPETADDETIKKAYLRKVREFPPERAAERFQAVRAAFEAVQSRRDRVRYRLFHIEPPTPAELLDIAPRAAGPARPDLPLLQRVLARTLTGGAG
ncbi:MAG: J domain-containing protein [Pseudomonadota bacterium]|nr:J domain-containing protein [Pseudomonadota bacterium]